MGFLIGDVNANRAVNAADIALTKSQTGQTVTASNFRAGICRQEKPKNVKKIVKKIVLTFETQPK